jgi:N-alpha-acetyl-L-2,4-diaminobutyrate deacetylase
MGTASRLVTDIDFDRDGKQVSYLRAPSSTNQSAYGTVLIPLIVIRNGDGPTLLLTGAVHGDEYEGPVALARLARTLAPDSIRGRIVILPALNLPALTAGTRLSPVDGLNLNRVFPGDANGSLTEMIAHHVASVLIPLADIVVDLHSGGMTLDYVPTAVMHWRDDPAWMAATLAAVRAFGAPIALVSRELDNAVYLDTIAENLGKITLSAELGGAGTVSRRNLAITERGLRNLLRHFGMMAGAVELDPASPTRLMQTPDVECYAVAEEDGVYEPLVELGGPVTAGQPLGLLHFLDRPAKEPVAVIARRDGLLICRRPLAQARRGDCLGIVAWDYPADSA